MKAWITTYALTTGIKEVDGEISEQFGSVLLYGQHSSAVAYGEGENWHRTKESAVARAEEMRLDRIESLMDQLAALQRLRFAVETKETTEQTS